MIAPTKPRRRALDFGAIAALILAISATVLVRDAKTGTEDFGHFYRAADAMRHGSDIYAAANGHYIYPPLLAFVLQPLTLFPENTAIILWLALSAVTVGAAAVIAAQEVAQRWLVRDGKIAFYLPWAIAAAATLLSADKLHKMFGLGQSDAFVLLGFALVLRWMKRRPFLAGVVVGAVANVKYLSVIFVPYFLVKRNFRAAFSAMLSFIVFLAIPAIETGWNRGVGYAAVAFGGLGHLLGLEVPNHHLKINAVTWDRSISLTSAVFRLTRSFGLPDLAGLTILFLLGAAILASLILLARRSGVALFRTKDARAETLEWAIMIFIAVAFSPQTTARHMVLLLLVYLVGLAVFLAQTDRRTKFALAGSMLLTAASLSLPSAGKSLDLWRNFSGPSWCALLLILVLVGFGARTIAIFDERGG